MNRSLLIVIVIAAILLLIAGGVLYWALSSDTPQPTEETEQQGGFFPSFFGFGDKDTPSQTQTSSNTQNNDTASTTEQENTVPILQLRQLWNEPVAGVFIEDGIVRFIDQATGHIYQTATSTTRTERITNTTIPRIQEVLWPSVNKLLVRYLEDNEDGIETFAATIVEPDPAATSTEIFGELRGQFLPTNIVDITVREDGTLFYLTERSGRAVGVVSNFTGGEAREVFSSVIRDWLPAWIDTNTVALTTKAAARIPGSLVGLNTKTGSLTPILANIFGLETNVHSERILYTQNDGTGLKTFIFNEATGATTNVFTKTLPEKCVWGSQGETVLYCGVPTNTGSGTLPDEWYRGQIHFSDALWKIHVATGDAELLFDPKTITADSLDMVNLQLNDEETYLVFRNKTDGTPWLLRLTEEQTIETPEEN